MAGIETPRGGKWLGIPLLCLALGVFPAARAATMNVFAAASLTDGLKEIAANYEKQSGDKVLFNFAASSFLARQIEEGAPADIFFSADESRMDALEGKALLVPGTRKSRLSNSLVVVTTADSRLSLPAPSDLTNAAIKKIALADPMTVPAGIYSRQYLQKAGLWDAVRSKVVPTDNVRAALAAVESGNVEAGMVYKTDAATSKHVKVTCEIPASETPGISYAMALLKDSRQQAAAGKFLHYLDSEDAAAVFRKYGFIIRN